MVSTVAVSRWASETLAIVIITHLMALPLRDGMPVRGCSQWMQGRLARVNVFIDHVFGQAAASSCRSNDRLRTTLFLVIVLALAATAWIPTLEFLT